MQTDLKCLRGWRFENTIGLFVLNFPNLKKLKIFIT